MIIKHVKNRDVCFWVWDDKTVEKLGEVRYEGAWVNIAKGHKPFVICQGGRPASEIICIKRNDLPYWKQFNNPEEAQSA